MNIAIIDDQEDIQYAIEKILKKEGHTCYGFYGDEEDLIEGFDVFDIDLIIMDMMLKDSLTGLNVLAHLRDNDFNIPTIMITAYTTPSNMIEASVFGITDIIKKPFSAEDIITTVNRYSPVKKTKNISLVQDDEQFIGSFEIMKDIYKHIGIAANNNSNLFIYGDTGTGKELVAKLVHKNSKNSSEPFVAVHCSTLPENIFEKLMFGRVENYFKNDNSEHIGYVQLCSKGTLYLDSVSSLPIQSQLKLLRFLETKKYYPLGSPHEVTFEGRIICSSNKNPKSLLEDNDFRDDLYYRIATLEIGIPSLEERKDDIKALVEYYISSYNKELNINCSGITSEALEILINHSYKGNIRELTNIIYKAMLSTQSESINYKCLYDIIYNKKEENTNYMNIYCQKILEHYETKKYDTMFIDFEKEMLGILLKKTPNISQLSKLLGMSRNTLKDKIKKYNIEF